MRCGDSAYILVSTPAAALMQKCEAGAAGGGWVGRLVQVASDMERGLMRDAASGEAQARSMMHCFIHCMAAAAAAERLLGSRAAAEHRVKGWARRWGRRRRRRLQLLLHRLQGELLRALAPLEAALDGGEPVGGLQTSGQGRAEVGFNTVFLSPSCTERHTQQPTSSATFLGPSASRPPKLARSLRSRHPHPRPRPPAHPPAPRPPGQRG